MPSGYQPERYVNASLHWFYRVLRAVALEEELPSLPEDKTLPKFKSINTVSVSFYFSCFSNFISGEEP